MTSVSSRFSLVPRRRLRPHEEVDEDAVERLADEIRSDGRIFSPVIVDEGTRVILDGHHRYAALGHLGCELAPCHLVDYNDPTIRVEGWEDGRPMDKHRLIQRAMSGDLYPHKTSRHRTLSGLPDHATPLAHCRPDRGAA